MTSRPLPPIACAALAALATVACNDKHPGAHPPGTSASASATASAPVVRERFDVAWDPSSGRGAVTQRYDDGDIATVCLHCRFPGYTGGLVVGSYNGSGFEIVPSKPLRGFSSLNIFCAQDESIWDRDTKREWSYGWSENFGRGPDGERLAYVRGKVHERGPAKVLLSSRNRGGCYQVDKALAWPSEARFLVIATRIRNVCDRAIRFDFWTGDDPWIGRYRSSEGDVGYTNEGLVRTETRVDPTAFAHGGLYDLGNRETEEEGGFSGASNFVVLGPDSRRPDAVYFANRFAHEDNEVDPARVLDNKSMIALNIGFRAIELKPGEGFELQYALGRAISTGRPEPPLPPSVPVDAWAAALAALPPAPALRFDWEHVELDVTSDRLVVIADYAIANDAPQPRSLGILYPFATDKHHPKPHLLEVDGKALAEFDAEGARWSIKVPAAGTKKFRVRYEQRLLDKSATYIVTSANRWSDPIRRAEFVVRHSKSFRDVTLSYEVQQRREQGDSVELRFSRSPFAPERDVVLTWR